jgi:UMF1 family MFS transporter
LTAAGSSNPEVFNTYLSSSPFGNPAHESELLGVFTAVAGIVIAVVAPVAGHRTDASGRRKLWLGINSGVVALCLIGTVFVKNEPGYLWLGLTCIAVGTVFYELASVFYNSLLPLVSTPKTVGKVSAFGWSMGYFGGIVLLVIILVFVKVKVPPPAAEVAAERTGFFAAYGVIFRNVRDIWRASPNTIWFLLASAIFRDGLTGVFTFGGVLGHVAFGLSTKNVLVFGIAANVIAGIATVSSGRLDDRLGPKPVIVTSLIGMSGWAILLFATRDEGAIVFWTFASSCAPSSARRSRRAAPSSRASSRRAARERCSASTRLRAARRSGSRPRSTPSRSRSRPRRQRRRRRRAGSSASSPWC